MNIAEDSDLSQKLLAFPFKYGLRYNRKAQLALQQTLFLSLVGYNSEYLDGIFNHRTPRQGEEWSLSLAQGRTEDIEYSEAARGKACAHIFKSGDCLFHCATCTSDESACLCSRCFEASDHEDHIVTQKVCVGNSGCCDCGDDEAWALPIHCAIHTADPATREEVAHRMAIPDELVDSIRSTISKVMDYIIEVFSCSPENLRLAMTEDTIRLDEKHAKSDDSWDDCDQDLQPEFALILWNDEKHTVTEVQEQVKRACKQTTKFGLRVANEANDYGRSVVEYSQNLRKLLQIAGIIKQINITVTIRSSRDTFREQMCGTMIDFLKDIASCSIGHEHDILRQIICDLMLQVWRPPSDASNIDVGERGLDDHAAEDLQVKFSVYGLIYARPNVMMNIETTQDVIDSISDPTPIDNNTVDDANDLQSLEASLPTENSEVDPMDIDLVAESAIDPISQQPRAPNEMEAGGEVSEATFAGYPPPPPPPPAPPTGSRTGIAEDIVNQSVNPSTAVFSPITDIEIPRAPTALRRTTRSRPPEYWLQKPELSADSQFLPGNNLKQRIRLDWYLLYDLRLWKSSRIDLRDLYIKTILASKETRRVFGLRFGGLYSILGQLYLIADREQELSVINLSAQIFTVPSVTQDVMQKANILTTLFSMLYTYLTQRTVSQPYQISVEDSMTTENNSVSNRRMHHFFLDLNYLLDLEYVKAQICTQQRYQLQFLDLLRLPQGICPNHRHVGEHIEYESDLWISAQFLTKDFNKLIRQIAAAFPAHTEGATDSDLRHFIRLAAKAAIVNSMGGERGRFDQAEIKFETRFKPLESFHFERCEGFIASHSVVDFVVEREAISFHHPLHNMLSWLIECGKAMPARELRDLLSFTLRELRQPPPYRALVPNQSAEDYLLAVFDFPLRVCTWLAQMKAGMWVRNGLSLRHQMTTYRNIAQRELTHERDIFLLQTALVLCDPGRVLATFVERFGMDQWMRGNYVIREGFDAGQQIDVAEDFIHLLIILISDRTSLQLFPSKEAATAASVRRDIAHILCFKPLSFSDIDSRIVDRPVGLDHFQAILNEMTTYKAPEGLSDTGSFELKGEYHDEIDPYAAHYSKNQREEAETACRVRISKRIGKPLVDVVYEPKVSRISSGTFAGLTNFTTRPLFAQIIFHSLFLGFNAHRLSDIPPARFEVFLHVVLHLILITILEPHSHERSSSLPSPPRRNLPFVSHALQTRSELGLTIFDLLVRMFENSDYKNCHPQIRLILYRMRESQPGAYQQALSYQLGNSGDSFLQHMDYQLSTMNSEAPEEMQLQEARRLKKEEALARQAKVMAQFQQQQQKFLQNQDIADWDEDEDPITSETMEDQTKIWRFPSDNCILCQEETNDARLYGTFGMMTKSSLFRETDTRDAAIFAEVLHTPESLDRPRETDRPFGLAGWNRSYISKKTSSGGEVETEHQGLAKGYPSAFTKQKPVSTGCGHIMHYTCFENYCQATQRRQTHQVARQHPEKLGLREFVCPLCKALGNAFLPIIWRGKEETHFSAFQAVSKFEEWITSEIGLSFSKAFKTQKGKSDYDHLQELYGAYISRNLASSLSLSLLDGPEGTTTSPISPRDTSLSWHPSMPGVWQNENETLTSSSRAQMDGTNSATELLNAYSRLTDTTTKNCISSQASSPVGESPIDVVNILAKMLGWSIAGTEIAHRAGPAETDSSVIGLIPVQTLTYLRVLSETMSSFTAVALRAPGGLGLSAAELSQHSKSQLLQIFTGHPDVDLDVSRVLELKISPALLQDSFVLLVESSNAMVPIFDLDISNVLRITYTLEIVKATLAVLEPSSEFQGEPNENLESLQLLSAPQNILQTLRDYMDQLVTTACLDESNGLDAKAKSKNGSNTSGSARWLATAWKAISTYALVFVRKATIFMHIKYGLIIPEGWAIGTGKRELERLSEILHLPPLLDLLQSLVPGTQCYQPALSDMTRGWIQHWHHNSPSHAGGEQALSINQTRGVLSQAVYNTMKLGHPSVYELVGLPKQFDILTFEATKRRCPNKGTKLEDPNICLFCGEIFCGQVSCCSKKGTGGCYQHMQKCGKNVGLFINIRKCTGLMLHDRSGSWCLAPYLDKFGEPDPGLRRGRRLALNQKRYDKLLRDIWLYQTIPTTIARKLESEINNGGWETL